VAAGAMVYSSGLHNPFMGDDYPQIVNNLPVHSLSNIREFFESGTMYNATGGNPLTGTFYRPLMTVTFSLLYTAFGPNPFPFHLLQFGLMIACALLCFLLFRRFLAPLLSLLLALVFLVHPMNSQAVFAVPSMQEPLFLAFGMLGLWLLTQFDRGWSILASAVCLLLSLLSKETGVLFVFVAALYLVLFSRRRVARFFLVMTPIVVAYLLLKAHAVGLADAPHLAPIDNLSLFERLANLPAIVMLYLGTFFFPLHIASGYYWTYSYSSLQHFWAPLFFELTLVVFAIYYGLLLRKKNGRAFRWYVFFATWIAVGIAMHSQVFPLDETASDTWFFFPMVGLLSVLGILVTDFGKRWRLRCILAVGMVIVVLLGVRTWLRGFDWQSEPKVAAIDLPISENNYAAENVLAHGLYVQGDLAQARTLAEKSVANYTVASNTDVLGHILAVQGNYAQAKQAFQLGLKHQRYYVLDEDLADLSLVYPQPPDDRAFLEQSLKRYPKDPYLWLALAVNRFRAGDVGEAQRYALFAKKFGDSALISKDFASIMENKPLDPQ
jgi:hypothetical protein